MEASLPFEIPAVINGKPVSYLLPSLSPLYKLMEQVKSGNIESQPMPHDHAKNLCTYHSATPETVQAAIDGALSAKPEWEDMPWADRAAIFLKAADLIAGKYRFEVMAATMLGQGKNAWQAEIDAAAEVIFSSVIHGSFTYRQTIDFLRFSVKYVEQLYAIQPPRNSQGVWK
jgi:1-pyrroline-5-carboxylate dehydrogenase